MLDLQGLMSKFPVKPAKLEPKPKQHADVVVVVVVVVSVNVLLSMNDAYNLHTECRKTISLYSKEHAFHGPCCFPCTD